MIDITDKAKCCGCGACAQICPKVCITMRSDLEGFLYPKVDEKNCVQCSLCEHICPILNAEPREETVLQTIVGYHQRLDTRLASSSGGIFSLLAEDVLQRNGKVYGAAFDANFEVHHIGINSVSDLTRLQGSKYIQSRMEQTYQQVKLDLLAGKEVLFSGVSCQVEGLKQYLQKNFTNLLTVDVLCHGVPSPLVWKKYLEWQASKFQGDVEKVFFRKKNHGWKQYEMELHFTSGKIYHQPFNQDSFMHLFLSEICLRPSCYQCQFKALERQSDITIGDCWGIQDYMPDMDDDQGTSVILVHTERGQNLISRLSEKMCFKQAEADRALPPTADSRKPVTPHPKRKQFFKVLAQTNDIDRLVKFTRPTFLKRVLAKLNYFLSN